MKSYLPFYLTIRSQAIEFLSPKNIVYIYVLDIVQLKVRFAMPPALV